MALQSEEVTGAWRKLQSQELPNLYSSQNIKEDEMARTCSTHERWKMHTKCWSGNLEGRDHLEDMGVHGRI